MAKNKLLTVRMTADELAVLNACAGAKGFSVAQYLRILLGFGTGAVADSQRAMITDSAPSTFEPSANVLTDLERLRNKMFAKYRPGYVADAADPGHTCFATQWIGELAKVWTKMMADPMVLMLKNPGDKQSPSGPQSSSGQIAQGGRNANPGKLDAQGNAPGYGNSSDPTQRIGDLGAHALDSKADELAGKKLDEQPKTLNALNDSMLAKKGKK